MAEPLHAQPTSCLGDDMIAGFLGGGLRPDQRDEAAQHLIACATCRLKLTDRAQHTAHTTQTYSSLLCDEAGTGFELPADESSGVLAAGTSLGRYVLLSKVGAGGMGVVYSAFDPELNRRIAIKVIRTGILRDSERAHAMLRDEARAMAKLTHPNVVRVYDVGTQGQLVYIAMEFVDGENLLQFAERHRERGAWRPILDACLQAGRGLQAAHEAGLVHRDFKPSNVLVTSDSRVFVADFGLTRLFSKSVAGRDVDWTSASGTPGYAPPEQLAGKPCDLRSDQYSFCVTAAECLFGREPDSIFSRVDYSQRMKCPKRLGPVLERGLAKKNQHRYPSMRELLDALESRANRGRRQALVAASVAVLGGLGISMFALGAKTSHADDTCERGAQRFAKLWSKQRQDALARTLADSPYQRQASYFLATADDLASDLAKQQQRSCDATFKSKTQSAELYDRQMFCLGSQASELDAIISMIEAGTSVEAGQSALGSLPSVSECRVSESLLAMRSPPSDPRSLERIRSVETKLANRRALALEGNAIEALQSVEEALALATDIGYGPLITRAESLRAQLLEDLERYPEARNAAERARDAAAQGRDTRRLVLALLRLASIVSTHEDDADEAHAYVATARSLSLGIELPVLDLAQIEFTSGSLAQASGDHDQAVRYAEAGLKLLAGAVGEDAQETLNARISLLQIIASAHFARGELNEAGTLLREIYELETKRLGPEHSDLASSLINIATVEYQEQKPEEALVLLRRARELLKSPDAKHTDLGQALSLEALIQNRLGHIPEAIALYKQTIEVYEELFGKDHANIWRTKANLANSYMALERWDEALDIQQGFLDWAIERYGADSPTSTAAKLNLASTMLQAHYQDGKVEDGQQLLSELARDLAKDDPNLVGVRTMQGNAHLVGKQYLEAAEAFQDALRMAERTPQAEPSFPATTTGALADALWQGGKRSRALAVARDALRLYDKLESPQDALRAEQAAWLAEKEAELAGGR